MIQIVSLHPHILSKRLDTFATIKDMIITIALATFVATCIGGLIALRFRDKLHLILGFSAGAVIAVAFFDLIPEAFELSEGVREAESVALFIAVGFFLYLLVDRLLFFRSTQHLNEDDTHAHVHAHGHGALGAGGIVAHSFFDGLAIGLAFQVSVAVGALVATAVLIHKISDGITTVGIVLKGEGQRSKVEDKNTRNRALRWLAVVSLAPVLGIAVASAIAIPESSLGAMLAFFAGFFIYIGASELIPESHHSHPKLFTTVMTFLGAGVLYIAILFAHGH